MRVTIYGLGAAIGLITVSGLGAALATIVSGPCKNPGARYCLYETLVPVTVSGSGVALGRVTFSAHGVPKCPLPLLVLICDPWVCE